MILASPVPCVHGVSGAPGKGHEFGSAPCDQALCRRGGLALANRESLLRRSQDFAARFFPHELELWIDRLVPLPRRSALCPANEQAEKWL